MKFKQNKNVTALNLAILELDHRLRTMPHNHHNWAPLWGTLWNTVDEDYHPQDFLGIYSKTSQMAQEGFLTPDLFHSICLVPWGTR